MNSHPFDAPIISALVLGIVMFCVAFLGSPIGMGYLQSGPLTGGMIFMLFIIPVPLVFIGGFYWSKIFRSSLILPPQTALQRGLCFILISYIAYAALLGLLLWTAERGFKGMIAL